MAVRWKFMEFLRNLVWGQHDLGIRRSECWNRTVHRDQTIEFRPFGEAILVRAHGAIGQKVPIALLNRGGLASPPL